MRTTSSAACLMAGRYSTLAQVTRKRKAAHPEAKPKLDVVRPIGPVPTPPVRAKAPPGSYKLKEQLKELEHIYASVQAATDTWTNDVEYWAIESKKAEGQPHGLNLLARHASAVANLVASKRRLVELRGRLQALRKRIEVLRETPA